MPARTFHSTDGHDATDQAARIDSAIDRLLASINGDARIRHLDAAFLPDRGVVVTILERLHWLLFPGFFGSRDISPGAMRDHVAAVVHEVHRLLLEQVSAAMRYELHEDKGTAAFQKRCAECDARAAEVVQTFLTRLPEVRRLLSLDVQAAYDGDPAAQHTDEIIFCYPGLRAISTHRLAHELYRLEVPLIPRIMSEHAHSQTGIDIHPGARIGASFFIDHGTGVVIGETSVIGDHCRIYQGVTLGAAAFPKDEHGRLVRGTKRHPTLEDHVIVYAGATILGGNTVIGAGSVVNGGVFLTQSVPPGHVVRGPKAEIKLRANPDLPPSSYAI